MTTKAKWRKHKDFEHLHTKDNYKSCQDNVDAVSGKSKPKRRRVP